MRATKPTTRIDCYVLEDGRRVLSQRGIVGMLTADPQNTEKTDGTDIGDLGRYLKRLPSKFRHLSTGPTIEFSRLHGGLGKGLEAARRAA